MSILEMLQSQLASGDSLDRIASQVGADPGQTGRAVGTALPALLAALSANAVNAEGAEALAGALDRDHDGSILEDLGGFLGRGDTKDGEGILRHVLGEKRPVVEAAVAREGNLDTGLVSKLLPLLAPLIMGALGREKRSRGLDAAGLVGLLSGEGKKAQEAAPGLLGTLGPLLGGGGEGLDAGDIADVGKSLLGGFLKRGR